MCFGAREFKALRNVWTVHFEKRNVHFLKNWNDQKKIPKQFLSAPQKKLLVQINVSSLKEEFERSRLMETKRRCAF